MVLVSMTPLAEQDGVRQCMVRVYACARGSKMRTRMLEAKFNRTPDAFEVGDLQRRPQAYQPTAAA